MRAAAIPGSALALGIAAAQAREPSADDLRALETRLAAALGAAAMGMDPRPPIESVSPASSVSAGPRVLAAGGLKMAAVVLVAIAAVGGGALWRRQSARARAAIVAAQPAVLMVPGAAPVAAAAAVPSLPASDDGATFGPPEDGAAAVRRAPGPAPRPVSRPDELALIARAQQALARDPARALALVDEDGRGASRVFAQEAEVIAVAALTRLGRADEARQRAARFVHRFPWSVYARRMRRAAALDP